VVTEAGLSVLMFKIRLVLICHEMTKFYFCKLLKFSQSETTNTFFVFHTLK